jgi:hypothetical protein
VEWLDARDWQVDTLALDKIPSRVGLRLRHSKGWLVYAGPDINGVEVTVLASTFDPPETDEDATEYGDFTVIPTGWVRSVKYRTRRPKIKKETAE